jgi:hypothetical protein
MGDSSGAALSPLLQIPMEFAKEGVSFKAVLRAGSSATFLKEGVSALQSS